MCLHSSRLISFQSFGSLYISFSTFLLSYFVVSSWYPGWSAAFTPHNWTTWSVCEKCRKCWWWLWRVCSSWGKGRVCCWRTVWRRGLPPLSHFLLQGLQRTVQDRAGLPHQMLHELVQHLLQELKLQTKTCRLVLSQAALALFKFVFKRAVGPGSLLPA